MAPYDRPADTAFGGRDDRRVTVIVVNHGTTDDLPRCVAAFDAQDLGADELEIVVVDNATPGAGPTLDGLVARAWKHRVRVVANATNRGYAGAINDVLAGDTAPVVVFSNVDVDPAPDAVRRCRAVLDDQPTCGSVQPLLVGVGTPAHIDSTGHVLTRARVVANRDEGRSAQEFTRPAGDVFGVSGAFAVHRRRMLDDVAWRGCGSAAGQILTEDLFAFFEDVELDWRARRRGWTAWFAPDAVVGHERGGRGARRPAIVEELNWANRLLVMATCDDRGDIRRHGVSVGVTTMLSAVVLGVRHPMVLARAIIRYRRGRAGANLRRRELDERARCSAASVLDEWAVDLRWRAWLATALRARWRAGATTRQRRRPRR
ncbi:MAG: glycosyltransferase family 2 protein [Nitriliruptoraceae bacterium]